jgi:riboflavin kinase/FMN adenylyltransferase
MKIIRQSSPIPPPTTCAATIGFFDGVHKGHCFLIDQVKEIAVNKNIHSAIITFPTHPRRVIDTGYCPEILTTCDEKTKLLAQTEIDYCMVLKFTMEIARLSARQFMANILCKQYNVQTLVIGYDHRFGHNRSENFDDYSRYGKELGIEVLLAQAYTRENTKNINSSLIRSLLYKGEVDKAAVYLGYNYFLTGVVVNGNQVGRHIGFPTANIYIENPHKLIPADGVYAVRVTINEKSHIGMLNIGQRPTLNNGTHRSIEVHILHFHSDIYHRPIRISFVQRIRPEKKFNNIEQLTTQLHKDAAVVKSLLSP